MVEKLAPLSQDIIDSAAKTLRVSYEDIQKALKNLHGPVDRDEAIVMACAQAILWAMEKR